jgi:hypothetical protein
LCTNDYLSTLTRRRYGKVHRHKHRIQVNEKKERKAKNDTERA